MGCSNENSETENPDDEIEMGNSEPSDDINTLWIANMTQAAKGHHLEITKTRKSTITGNSLLRERLGLKDSTAIFSVSGGSYNIDGSHPITKDDLYTAYSPLPTLRNNVTISFTFTDDEFANAELVIDQAMVFAAQGGILPGEGNFARPIEQGIFTIRVKSERLNDAIPPLGKDINGDTFESFTYEDIDIPDEFESFQLNAYKLFSDDTPIDVGFVKFREMVRTAGNVIPIKIIETAVVQNGERLELVEPLNF
ncbi:hypothetical protein [uncultured Croceitalea sp.]|uniref:hypothetical protein n=1 Tax=uncultured Croceitalea sp. TaxID=1798908 RepID=UPI00374FD480